MMFYLHFSLFCFRLLVRLLQAILNKVYILMTFNALLFFMENSI